LPWEVTANYIRSGHRRTIVISEDLGIKAVVGKPKGKTTMEVVSYLFDVSKGWTLEKAKDWFERHQQKPLRIRGVALTAGMSRNLNIYLPEELEAFRPEACFCTRLY
jgi:hypothetical protein